MREHVVRSGASQRSPKSHARPPLSPAQFSCLNAHDGLGDSAAGLNVAPFSLPDLASDLVDILGPEARMAHAELSVVVAPELFAGPLVLGDAARLRQVSPVGGRLRS